MAVRPFTNYANVPLNTPDYGITSILPSILKGYEAAKAPETYKNEQEYKKALTAKALKEAQLGTLTSHARVAQDLQQLEQSDWATDETKALARQLLKQAQEHETATTENIMSLVNERDFNSLPEPYKIQILGEYDAKGYGALEGKELYRRGVYPADLQQANTGSQKRSNVTGNAPPNAAATPEQQTAEALKQNNPADKTAGVTKKTKPIPRTTPMTSADISTVNQLMGSSAEEAYIAPKVTEALNRYSRKFFGKSPTQIWDSLSPNEKDVNNLGAFYAAQAIQSGIAGNRARLENSSTAMQAIRDIKQSSLNMIDSYDWQVSPEIYKKTQELVSEWIQGMTNERIKGIKGEIQHNNQLPQAPKQQNPADTLDIMNIVNRKEKK